MPVMGILAALIDARSSGRGRHVDVAMTDAVFAHAILLLVGFLEHGKTPGRGTGMLGGGLPCYNVYRTRDGRYMAVGALERKFWETLCDILGCPELKEKHIVYGEEARPVKERLAAIFASRAQREWAELFARADCCVSPILTLDEALANEQLRARGMSIVEDGLRQFASPVKFSEFEFSIERPAPGSGEHTDEILREAGYGDTVVDLGSGDGRIMITAARKYGARGFGVELDPRLVRRSNDEARRVGVADRVKFLQQDLFTTDFHEANVLTLYLLPDVNMALRASPKAAACPSPKEDFAAPSSGLPCPAASSPAPRSIWSGALRAIP